MTAESERVTDTVLGCVLGGAIGDAFGGINERGRLCLSDDTQLTLATCESISVFEGVDPAHIASTFTRWFRERRLSGLGSATVKALRDLEAGAHWALSGAKGEMAAGNGGAMRIAPLAFVEGTDRTQVRDVVRITHHSDEAYLGALAVVLAIHGPWSPALASVLTNISEQLPDCRVRDRLRAVAQIGADVELEQVAGLGSSGYVVDTVPLAIAAAWFMAQSSFEPVLEQLVAIGGDTDTIAAIAGQIYGSRKGFRLLPEKLLVLLPERGMVQQIAEQFAASLNEQSGTSLTKRPGK